jgi:1-acyl-sn-glycerol-3-phosphate acyltransferase
VLGEPTRPPSLLLANHLSWIDILVLAGATGCAFVSKDDIGHPILRWLADQNATLYVRRSERGAVRGQASMIAEALRAEQPVTLFPEGTVGPGDALLPFRSSLLEAVALAPANVAVQPVALDYGSAATHISWHGESGADNVRRVLGRKGVLPVTVRLLEPLARLGDRKQLAASARAAIAGALDASSPAASRL